MIAAGLGCRSNCPVEDILAAIAGAVEQAGVRVDDISRFCAPDFKRHEIALTEAAQHLQRPIIFVATEALAAYAAQTKTRSDRVFALYGVPSIAETAALAGVDAGAPAHLMGPRFTSGGAACALASSDVAA